MTRGAFISCLACFAAVCVAAPPATTPATTPATRPARRGEPPLVRAIVTNDPAAALKLIDAGADVDARDRHGMSTALYYACWKKGPPPGAAWANLINPGSVPEMRQVVERLVDRGANVNARCIGGFTPLHRACESGAPGLVEYLVAKGADVTAADEWGYTPLHVQCRDDDAATAAIAATLLAKGADVNAVSGGILGVTPLDVAHGRGLRRTADVLRAAGGKSRTQPKWNRN
jgi:hypothetical protein